MKNYIFDCLRCNQRLRIQTEFEAIKITCPSCKYSWQRTLLSEDGSTKNTESLNKDSLDIKAVEPTQDNLLAEQFGEILNNKGLNQTD